MFPVGTLVKLKIPNSKDRVYFLDWYLKMVEMQEPIKVVKNMGWCYALKPITENTSCPLPELIAIPNMITLVQGIRRF